MDKKRNSHHLNLKKKNRKKKKDQKEKQKLKQKMALKMNFQNDIVDHNLQGDNQMFSLNKIKTKKVLDVLTSTLKSSILLDFFFFSF
jgi:hypothetical protein